MASAAPPAKRALVPIAPGSEDIEASTVVDILRRAGVAVDVAAVTPRDDALGVTLARGLRVTSDVHISAAAGPYDLIALPGGMPGATHLAECAPLGRLLAEQAAAGRWVAAVCAAPAVVLLPAGIVGPTTRATAHANFAARLPRQDAVEGRVVVDGNVITSRGPGTSIEWGLACVEALLGTAAAAAVAAPLHLPPGVAVGWGGGAAAAQGAAQ